jgi:hypothetical protein
MNLINQTMRKQIVPERPAASHQNFLAWLTFEFGNLLVRIWPPDEACIRQLFWQPIGQRIRDDDSRDGLAREISLCSAVHSAGSGF